MTTQQLSLSTEARARTGDPFTSHEAAQALDPAAICESQQAVLAVLAAYGPMTDEALAFRYSRMRDHHGYPRQSPSGLRTRRKELAAGGLVFDTGLTERLASGRRAIVWAARKLGEAAA